MTKITNHSKTMKIVKLEDGSSLFMKSGQTTETKNKVASAPVGVTVDISNSSGPKRPKTPKLKEESEDNHIPEENS